MRASQGECRGLLDGDRLGKGESLASPRPTNRARTDVLKWLHNSDHQLDPVSHFPAHLGRRSTPSCAKLEQHRPLDAVLGKRTRAAIFLCNFFLPLSSFPPAIQA